MLRTKSFLASTLIAMTFAFGSNAMADDFDDLPNVQQYVVDDATSMSALARTEQKLGYMGDIDDVRWTLYKCISLDVGAGVIRAGLGCETTTSTGGSTQVSDEYKKLQEEFSDTVCKQNANWETFTSQMGNKQKAGTVSCSSLAHAYCSASNAEKASANLTTYYECTKNGKPISCVDLAETYCTITNIHPGGSSEEDSGSDGTDTGSGSTSGTSDADKAAIQQKEKEDQAKEAVTKSNKRKCIVDGEEVDCDDLAEANEIRKKTNKESTFDDDSTECYADITCKDSDGLTVDCKKARDVIQCGQSSSEGLSIEYSCFVGGATVDCGFLGEGECTESVCNEMCPEYGGAVLNNTCTCYNVPAVCAGMCEYGAQVSENSRSIATVEVTNSGSGYSDRGVLSKENLGLTYTLTAQSSTPKVKVTIYDEEGSGSGATGEAVYTVDNTNISTTINITGITINTTGSGYTSPKATVNVSVGNNSKAWGVALDTITYPTVTVSDSTGSGAVLKAIINNGKVTAIQVLNGGTYYVDPVITITSNAGSGAEAKVSKITDCVCNEMPDCSVECEFSGVPVGNGTNKCDCYTEPDCNDASHCKYGGYPEVKSDDSAYVCTEATCPYGYLTDDNPDKCDASICPYGTSSGGDDCSDSSICPYGGTKNADGSCACNEAPKCIGGPSDYPFEDLRQTGTNFCEHGGSPKADGSQACACYDAPVCSGPQSSQTTRSYYANSFGQTFEFCVYGGEPHGGGDPSCKCYDETICTGSSTVQTGTNYCTYGGTAKADGTSACSCDPAPDCTALCDYGGTPKANGTQACACIGDCSSLCDYGGTLNADLSCTCDSAPVCSGPQSSQTGDYYVNSFGQTFEFCAYGGSPSGDGTQSCVCNEAPECYTQCPQYGGTPTGDGTQSCACNDAPVCSGPQSSQTGDYYISSEFEFCAYGGSALGSGTQMCLCESAPNCNVASVCPYGGTAKANGTQDCSCYSAPNCNSVCTNGGTAKADGTQGCTCNTGPTLTVKTSAMMGYATLYLADGTTIKIPENTTYTIAISKLTSNSVVLEGWFGMDDPICGIGETCGTNTKIENRIDFVAEVSIVDRSKNASIESK